jgi:hypothetical protein
VFSHGLKDGAACGLEGRRARLHARIIIYKTYYLQIFASTIPSHQAKIVCTCSFLFKNKIDWNHSRQLCWEMSSTCFTSAAMR